MPPLKKPRKTGFALLRHQLLAMIIKRWQILKRSKISFVAEAIMPACFMIFAMVFSQIFPQSTDQPPLELQPWMLAKSTVTSGASSLQVFFQTEHRDPQVNAIEKALIFDPHLGVRCTKYGISGFPCERELENPAAVWHLYNSRPNETTINNTYDDMCLPSCNCGSGFQQCAANERWHDEWPNTQISTTDWLRQMTTHNVSSFIIRTTPTLQRYLFGGFTLGARNPAADLIYQNWTIDPLPLPPVSGIESTAFGDITASSSSSSSAAPIDGPLSSKIDPEAVLNATEFFVYTLEDLIKSLVTPRVSRVWFNNKGWTSSVAYLNALSNARLRALANLTGASSAGDSDRFAIRLINHPINQSLTQFDSSPMDSDMVLSTAIIFALAFVPAVFVMFLIEERVSRSKLLQLLNGLHPVLYCLGNFLWDYSQFILSSILCMAIVVGFKFDMYSDPMNLSVMALTLFLYGFACVPLLYPFAYLFEVPSTAFVVLSSGNLFIGIITLVMTVIFEGFDEEPEMVEASRWMKKFFPMIPSYSLGRCFVEISSLNLQNQFSERYFGKKLDTSLYEFDVCGKYFLIFFVEGVIFQFFYIGLQYGFWIRWKVPDAALSTSMGEESAIDPDVQRERDYVLSSPPMEPSEVVPSEMAVNGTLAAVNAKASSSQLSVNISSEIGRLVNLGKVYQSCPVCQLSLPCCGCAGRLNHTVHAVRGLCLSLRRGECFGLLGVNGAGKTSTFKMLTGDHSVTTGDAFLCGYSVRNELIKVQSLIGYCPQFDALIGTMSGQEHLEYYARVRGLSNEDERNLVRWLLRKLDVNIHRHKPTQHYSGGTRRKLSTALALVGHPALIFLDEPTTGMDPGAKRFLWDAIRSLQRDLHCTVVLTTHSMEECEELCNRLAIMVNGEFKCLGSVQHLKNRFGNGYTLQLRLSHEQMYAMSVSDRVRVVERLHEELRQSEMPTLRLNDRQATILEFHLPALPAVPLTHVFAALERLRSHSELGPLLIDYSVCQTSLDQVFINFAKQQADAEAESDEVADSVPSLHPQPSPLPDLVVNQSLHPQPPEHLPHVSLHLADPVFMPITSTTNVPASANSISIPIHSVSGGNLTPVDSSSPPSTALLPQS